MKIGASTAYPDEILSIIPAIPVDEPREISENLRVRLQSASDANGRVPIHGRLFTQWLHNVFPRECPYPHQKGSVSLHTPEEWKMKMRHDSSRATDEEMSEVIADDTCRVDDDCGSSDMLPGSTHEELLETHVRDETDAHDDDIEASCWPLILSVVVSVASVVDCSKNSMKCPSSRVSSF